MKPLLTTLCCCAALAAASTATARAATRQVDAVANARLSVQGTPGHLIGSAFAAIPNVNGDGRPGLAISTGGDGLGRTAAGVVQVLFDTPLSGTVQLGDPALHGFQIVGANAYDEAGFNITSAGDVNGDGRGDILLSAPRNGFVCASVNSGPCGNAPHYAYVIYGKRDQATVDLAHLHRAQGFSIKGVPGGGVQSSQSAIAGLGRFDGNRYGAIALTAGHYSYVIWGGRDPANVDLAHLGSRGFRISAGSPRASGAWVNAAGDVNGDGRPDLLLSTGSIRSARHAGVFVVWGRHYTRMLSLNHLSDEGFAVAGADIGAGVGDFNGDHRADLLVQRANAFHPRELDVVYGSASSRRVDVAALGSRGFRILYGPAPRGYTLQLNVLAGLGDLNHDGLADAGIATEMFPPGGSGPFQGTVSVLFGARHRRSVSLQSLGANGYELSTAVPPASCPLGGSTGNELGHDLGALGNFSGGGGAEFAVGANGLGPVPSLCSLPVGEVLIEPLPSP